VVENDHAMPMTCEGVAVPQFVSSSQELHRWRLCLLVSADALQVPVHSEHVWSAARVLYFDRSIATE
jgi:hypothetical protein